MDIIWKDGEDEIEQRVYEQRENEIWIFKINENGEKIEESYINFEKKEKNVYE